MMGVGLFFLLNNSLIYGNYLGNSITLRVLWYRKIERKIVS